MSLESQLAYVANSVYHQLQLVGQVCPFLDSDNLATMTHVLLTLCLDYCNVLCVGLPLKLVQSLMLLQNATA